MSDSVNCIRCQRPIDRYAKSCVYCNWDQSEAVPPPQPVATAVPAYIPPPDHHVRNRVLGIVGFVLLVIVAFAVGAWFHTSSANDVKAAQAKAGGPVIPDNAGARSAPRSNVTLVPVADGGAPQQIEQSITSAPPTAPGQQPGDATALPSDQYAAVAEKAKALKKAASVDPRSLRGRAYEEQEKPRSVSELPPPMASAQGDDLLKPANDARSGTEQTREPATEHVTRTEALPQYQPLPYIRVERDTTARLTLTVGPDGRVKDVNINDTIPGETAKLIGAVQNWRFRPATENGTPVTAQVTVSITLRAHE